MKKKVSSFILFLIFLFLTFTLSIESSFAYTQEEEVCYSQCAAYKFVWQGDYCWDIFQDQCAKSKGNSILETIKFLKSIYDTLKEGKNVETVFKAWFVCKPLIESCINPQLKECRYTCSYDQLAYAPDISVGHPYSSFVYHGVIYNDRDHTLTFKVVNNGRGYAWDIGAEAYWNHTKNRDEYLSEGSLLFKETIPELIYDGARNGPPKTAGDYVKDFLIEESNFAQYLQGFKSDADNYDVPAVWYKTIPFTAPEGELTKITFKVDPGNTIIEKNDINNVFVLDIDNLPTPPFFEIENFTQKLISGTLNNFMIEFTVKNGGEENGQATVKIYEGSYKDFSQTPIYSSSQVVQSLDQFNFGTIITPDVSNIDTYCGDLKKYELVVFDNNKKVDSHEFFLPLYSGTVMGQVEDLFEKEVAGATITTGNGKTAVTDKNGVYRLWGLDKLGKITLTVTHPEFSKVETKDLELKIINPDDPCAEGSLTFNGVNFVLKDLDVNFTISIKDSIGNPVNAHVFVSSMDWRFENDINGNGPLPGMQPGKYLFTISAPGYKTISQDVNAVPENQDLEFTLEKLNGRPNDNGLTIQEPRILWELELGEEIFSKMTTTKNGKETILYTTRNKPNTGKVYFIDTMTGNQINAVSSTISTSGNAQACLDTSYDGNTTALFVHTGSFGIARDTENILILLDNQGREFGRQEFEPGSADDCDVSPDGFYIYPNQLINKSLYPYTRFDMGGVKSDSHMSYPGEVHFTTKNNLVAGCPKGGGKCILSLSEAVISDLGKIENSRVVDSSQDGGKIAIVTDDKAYLFAGDSKIWEKDVITGSKYLDIAISQGGKYTIFSTYSENDPYRTFKIFTEDNQEKTPSSMPDPRKVDVIAVDANDKGLFFATQHGKKISFYQVGSYSEEYIPESLGQNNGNNNGSATTDRISIYENGSWRQIGDVNYWQLQPGSIYTADGTINFQLEGIGKLKILNGTLFGVDSQHHPILLKGQISADFLSPTEVYAIKFDRFDMNLFLDKLTQFIAGVLPQSEYFVVKNVHTKFTVTNKVNQVKIAVENGQVNIAGEKIEEKIEQGKQATINEKNEVKKSNYLGWKIYLIVGLVLLIVVGVVIFACFKEKLGRKLKKQENI